MARSKIDNPTNDLITDSGAILWSFVKGEQLEFPIQLPFLDDARLYTFEAVVIEADNVPGQTERPTSAKVGGRQNTLVVRKPNYVGVWNAATGYNMENIVQYSVDSKLYRLVSGVNRVSAVTPAADPLWLETALNIVNLQFLEALASDWAQQPTVETPVYGFFELRVTEPNNSVFQRTWKPIRGMVEINYSPTALVPDV